MYISRNWLKDFIKMPAKISVAEIATELTSHTVEVEGFLNQADQFNNVVVGKVLDVQKHPNADRLRLVKVDVKDKILDIVCGAPNVSSGQLVPVALIGAKLPNGLEIKESLIRGEKSSGMICAEDELNLGKNHDGIMVLEERAKVGEPFSKYLNLDDVIFEVDNKSLSNRPDLLNHYGIARELSAIFSWPLKSYEKFLDRKIKFSDNKADKLSVKVDDPVLCPRYLAVLIKNVEVKESPDWLKARLVAIGQRPINNIVDLTNYVMFEIGQPLHAFSADNIKKIVVRCANKEESFETLDQKERRLSNEDLLITDGRKILAIAGVMGGQDSGVSNQTTELILESANFSASSIRKTSQRLGLRTEASLRFEKSLDPALTEEAALRFITLLREMCPNITIASSLLDINNVSTGRLVIDLDLDWLNDKIGQEIPRDTVVGGLQRLGFIIENEKDQTNLLRVMVPSWRATKDISGREDLAEEVLRLYGYDKIVSKLPVSTLVLPEVNEERFVERKIKNILAWKHNMNEAYNYSFVGEEQLTKLNIDFFQHLKLVNPLSETQTMLRQSLVPGLVANIKNNQFKSDDFGFFEIGTVFFGNPGNLKKDLSSEGVLPYQEKHLGLVLAGSQDLLGRLKGIIGSLFKNFVSEQQQAEFLVLDNVPGWADKNTAAKISLAGKELGIVAMVDVAVSDNLNLKRALAIAEINFSLLVNLILNLPAKHFQEPSKYPSVIRDLAFVVDEEILYNNIKHEIDSFHSLIKSSELFDVYTGDKLPNGQKSLAFHISYQSSERTLSAPEVDVIQQDLIDHLVQKFDARLRDF